MPRRAGELVDVARQPFGVIRVELPQLRQLGAERHLGIAGAPDLLAIPVLRRTLHIKAVFGVDIEVPAHRTGVILGHHVGIVPGVGNPREHRAVGIRPLIATVLGVELPVEALPFIEVVADRQAQTIQASTVAIIGAVAVAVETVVFLAGQRQAQITAIPPGALTGIKVVDATLAARDLQTRAMAVGWVAGDDVDHRHQRIGAVADRVRAAKYLDPVDVFHRYRDIAPVHRRQAGAIHRAAIDQHLHAPCFAGVGAVVIHRRLIAVDAADHHSRYQPQQFADVAGTAGADQFAIENGHASGHFRRRLLQSRGRQHLRQRLAVDEQIVRQHQRAEQQRQEQRRARGRRARKHDTACREKNWRAC